MRSGKPPGLVEISSWPYFTFLAAYAVEEVEARTNAMAIRPITAALIEIELGRKAIVNFPGFMVIPPSTTQLVYSPASCSSDGAPLLSAQRCRCRTVSKTSVQVQLRS